MQLLATAKCSNHPAASQATRTDGWIILLGRDTPLGSMLHASSVCVRGRGAYGWTNQQRQQIFAPLGCRRRPICQRCMLDGRLKKKLVISHRSFSNQNSS